MSHWYAHGKLVPVGTPGSLPSVTTILAVRNKPGIQAWRDRIGAEKADQHRDTRAALGSRVHKICEDIINGRGVGLSPDVLPYVEGFERFITKYAPSHTQPEVFLEHPLGYAGSADLVCTIDGVLWIIDYKTSKRISADYALQLVAYQQAYLAMTGKLARRAVLHLTTEIKRGYRFHPYSESTDAADWAAFQALKAVHDWVQTTEERETYQMLWTDSKKPLDVV